MRLTLIYEVFLDVYEDMQPYFVLVRRAKKYFSYASSGDWSTTDTTLPIVLMVAANASVQKRIRKKIARELGESWEDDLVFATTTLAELLTCSETNGKVWRQVDEDGDDPDEPLAAKSLRSLGIIEA